MSYKFFMPAISLMGADCLKDAGDQVGELGFKKALIVTDKVLGQIGIVKKVTDVLDNKNIEYAIYDETKPNPTVKNVNDGLALLKEKECDFVISLGGGSAHDCAKGIALLATNGGEIKDYEGVDKSKKPQLPMVGINTTAGTGSEMTLFAIITDEERHIKMALVDKHLTPIIAVNDPMLMLAMPKSLTAATGMDALTHAIEAYVSTSATPITDACAEKAIELISNYLVNAVENGQDVEARDMMAYAEYLAGMAFNNASLGYVHAMAHQLGGFYNLPHGVCNAILLPHVQEYNKVTSASRLAKIAKIMGGNIEGLTDEQGADLCIDMIKSLSQTIGIPEGLGVLGVKESDFETLATNALNDACSLTNPRKGNLEEVIAIFKKAM
ncbi:L-threonine dehydrogenase [Clostridium perfringens]|uniref:Alcohol dehydrogenase, iron-containing n=1 Tax=Clostridium perfringens E str. JGS1987 TaxID=451755 RepID=B1BNL4_CLOPF|nr:L-threonine dehydrogenase [Clostridium perfringens]EDT16723.1 alcohol dehydrogenase, iron-containing [Clostridium perfringens E str. JGS1987]EJT6558991.1 L-threonine dehydrogenase [Clostridium perfringens]ELC8459870.1 L-threonine dehydrogenase [Clostridium perfringens]MCX0376060.1 L-threonine dehydrogenase [Clostridium perfringens]HAT4243729.1 L-threonine dehydrogenase [Clostridium perfringens]